MTDSFVHLLEIAHDASLAPWRLPTVEHGFAARRHGSEVAPIEAPGAIGDNLRAAVDAGSILSFVSGLRAREMSDVLYSMQIAQRNSGA